MCSIGDLVETFQKKVSAFPEKGKNPNNRKGVVRVVESFFFSWNMQSDIMCISEGSKELIELHLLQMMGSCQIRRERESDLKHTQREKWKGVVE